MAKGLYIKDKYLSLGEIILIVLLACVPLFVTFPYRVNIFLSWEGAYRMSRGELPFRDFGTPLGGMYWVVPALFFKIFGAKMITLVKAQVFLNIISGLAFRSILKSSGVPPAIKFVSVLLYCLSFSFFNFWPWYNHTVIVYEFIGIAFLFKSMTGNNNSVSVVWLLLAAFFMACSFLTKQDAGAMGFLLSFSLLFISCLRDKKWLPLFIYTGFFIIILFLFIFPFLDDGFRYWFNMGQPPHSARVSFFEIIDEFFSASQWIKFYLFLIIIILVIRFRHWKQLRENKNEMFFLLLTLGILGEAAVFQVTSYTPPDNNIFFHSFAFTFIILSISRIMPVNISNAKMVIVCSLGVLLWWSSIYWKYIQRIASRAFPSDEKVISSAGENVINKKTFMIPDPVDSTDEPVSAWIYSGLKSFDKIYMPSSTVKGMKRLLSMPMIKNKKDIRVLNMSELTPLAAEIPYQLERGSYYPLWYHLGVGMFNKQAAMFEKKIAGKEYDLVLFEYIPSLNNFYPFRVRDSLNIHYRKIDSFPAPRQGDIRGLIEIYVKPTPF